MALWEQNEIDFEGGYDKADPIDDDDLNEMMNEQNISIQEQEELERRIRRTEWSSMDRSERTKLEQQIALKEEK